MIDEKEKKNRQIAIMATIGVHALVLLIMFFVIAWRAPDPPNPEYGIVLNFGTENEGSGDVQPKEPVGSEKSEEEKTEESKPQETITETQPQEVKPTEIKEAEVQPTVKTESPVVVKEKKEEPKPIEKPKEEPKKEEVKKETPKQVYQPSTKTETDKTTEGKEGKPGSQGDDKNKIGDKGNPQGDPDAKALYGKPGGGDGGVSMSGFKGFDWPEVKTPTLPEEAYGVYEFLVKVDENGDVINVKPLQRGLSLEAERKLKAMIQQLSFIPKGSNLPAISEGRISFKVVSK